MRNERKVVINHYDDLNKLMELTSGARVHAAMGYLTMWSFTGYAEVVITIYPEAKELTAGYFGDDGSPSFFMAGIWSETNKTFSFHS